MSDVAYVYNPDDEEDFAQFNGESFRLAPHVATEIRSKWPKLTAKAIADHLATTLQKWGVVVVSGPVKDRVATKSADQSKVDFAEAVYLRATKDWAEALLLERAKRNAPRDAAGLKDEPLAGDEVKATAWLKTNDKRLKAFGLV